MNEILANNPQFTIKQKWEEFSQKVIPLTGRNEVQYKEMRKAFYAGFVSFMFNLNEMPSGELLDDETYQVMCGNWYKEFNILIGVEASLQAIKKNAPEVTDKLDESSTSE